MLKEGTQLMKHQVEGLDLIFRLWNQGKGAALFHEMGLGKTLTALVACRVVNAEKILVVAPLSVLSAWESENQDRLKSPFKLSYLKHKQHPPGLLLVNYEAAWRRPETLLSWKPDTVILDEAHKIKSPKARQSQFLWNFSTTVRRLVLTGTPMAESPLDIWSIYRFLQPDIFSGSYRVFMARYAIMQEKMRLIFKDNLTRDYLFRNRLIEGGFIKDSEIADKLIREEKIKVVKYKDVAGFNHLEELKQKVATVASSKTKLECLDLPEKIHMVRQIMLSSMERDAYDQLRSNALVELSGLPRVEVTHLNTLILREQQVTSGMLPHIEDSGWSELGRSKLKEVEDLLTGELAGRQVVIYARFIADLIRLKELMVKLKFPTELIYGAVKKEQRQEHIQKFQAGELKVLVCQERTGGIGVNLQVSHHVIYYSMEWSVTDWLQSQDRIHRIGQEHACTYIYLLAESTIDETIYQALREGKNLSDLLTYRSWQKII